MKRFLTGTIVVFTVIASASVADAKRAITFNGTHLSGITLGSSSVTDIVLPNS